MSLWLRNAFENIIEDVQGAFVLYHPFHYEGAVGLFCLSLLLFYRACEYVSRILAKCLLCWEES